ncbi:MAG: LysR family transcriptional regulator [Bacteroidetes bacterium]|nr:LysR family transcriptional regulator [Bacteroidota bacterium]
MNIQQFQYVLAVAEHRHFETAAEKCFVAQSTLSTMISKFEEEIGISIFDRKKKPVAITKEGVVILKQLKVIIGEITRLDEMADELKDTIKGVLKIAVIPTIAPFLLPLFLQDFAKKHPQLMIEVKEKTTNEIIHQLKSRDLDIGIVSIPLQDDELSERFLYKEPFVLFDASGKTKKKLTAKEWKPENIWLLEEGHCMRNQVLEICNTREPEKDSSFNINFKAGSIDSLVRFAKANKGQTLLPYLAQTNFTMNEKKFLSHFKNPVPYRNIGLVAHRHYARKKIITLLQDEIIAKIPCTMND